MSSLTPLLYEGGQSPTLPRCPPPFDESVVSGNSLSAYLDQLEGWKPLQDESELAKAWIDWLTQEIDLMDPYGVLWIRALQRLAVICRRSAQFPTKITTLDLRDLLWLHGDQEHTNMVRRQAFINRGRADVFRCKYEGRVIAIKDFRANGNHYDERPIQYDRIVLWSRLRHPNIVPFISLVPGFPCAIANEWMDNGDITGFLERNPEEDRTSFMRDILTGVNFLHSLGIIHNRLKGHNVLVDGNRTARLADVSIRPIWYRQFEPAWWSRGVEIYRPPEYFGVTKEGDLFAVAHLFAEMCLPPFPSELKGSRPKPFKPDNLPDALCQIYLLYPLSNLRFSTQIERRVRPERPAGSKELGLTDAIWSAITRCWDEDPARRWEGWFLLIAQLSVALPKFNQGQAQAYAAKIKAEDAPPPRPIEALEVEHGIVCLPTWEDWPHTYDKPPPHLVYRHLNPLLEVRRASPMILPMIDLSFHRLMVMREDSIGLARHYEYLKAVPIPEEDLGRGIYAEVQDHEIRYIEVKCALIPGWRAKINEQSLRAGVPTVRSPPSAQTLVFASVEHFGQPEFPKFIDDDQLLKTGFFCGLLPQLRLSGPRIISESTLLSRAEKEKTLVESDMASDDAQPRSPSPGPPVPPIGLRPPVPDDEIQSLKALTVGDVFTGLWNAMHESLSEEASVLYTPAQRAKFTKLQFRRARRAFNLRPREKRALEDAGVIYADLLVDEVMFDGFVVTELDGRGGMELELLTRAPKEAELNWYQEMQR